MAIWALRLSSSLSRAEIFFRASGSVVCFTGLTPLWARFGARPGYLTTSRFTVLSFFGGPFRFTKMMDALSVVSQLRDLASEPQNREVIVQDQGCLPG
ncbi:hypothetical protein INR49_004058 [Caranx melampygus]|nr:hypothetical protein INR49_004058 [Caranx melampygus]